MKLIRVFNITSDEFWDYVEQGIVDQVQKDTKKPFKKKQIVSGYHYDNVAAKTKVTIDKYERGKIYQCTVKSYTDFIRVTYETKETDKGLEITFEQYVDDYEKNKDKKNKVSRTFHEWISFGRMSNTLYDMRNAIINKREGINFKTPKQMRDNRYKALRKFLNKKYNAQD